MQAADRSVAMAGEVAITTLRVGFALMFTSAVTDWLFAIVGGAGPTTMVEGVVLVGLAIAGAVRPHHAARLLCNPERMLVAALAFATVGAADWGVQTHYAEVAPAVIWIAAVVASPNWVLLAVVVSIGGFLGDFALSGRDLQYMLVGGGQSLVVNQVIDLVANAGAVLLLIGLLRRFVVTAPEHLAAVRAGAPAITPSLAAAVSVEPAGLLPRADARALTAGLTPSERAVLSRLAAGRAPKQIAVDLQLALATVRSHIASAKRRTGARTLEQLVALYAESGAAEEVVA